MPKTPSPVFRQSLGRFALTGVGATALHTVVALGLISQLNTSPPLANGVAFCVATIFSYVVNTLWSFSAAPAKRNFWRFLVVALIGLLLAMGLAWLAEQLHWPPIAGIALVVAIVPTFSFLLHRLWTYR